MSSDLDTVRPSVDQTPRGTPPDGDGLDSGAIGHEHPVGSQADSRSAGDLAMTAIRIVVWTFANLTFLLGAWVVLAWSLAGWSPVVITSDSMSPTLDAGDVILIVDDDDIGQRDVVVFERDDGLVAHRVFAVEDNHLITKGDANPNPDTDPVAFDEVVGSGRLVVPMVGLPIMWATSGAWLPFAAWALLTGAGIIGTALAADRAIRGRRQNEARTNTVTIARVGVQRVRVLTAILVVAQLVMSDDGFDLAARSTWLALGAVVTLLCTSALAGLSSRRGASERRLALFELAIDTALVVVLTNSTTGGLSWILFALPIIEAAVRFGLVGALLHWMVLTGSTLSFQLWSSSQASSADALDGLEQRLDQLGVLFLFVIPAAYLAEQLLNEVATWQRATGQAVDRSEILAVVADVGRDVVRLDGAHLDAILDGIRSIGFDRADVISESSDATWQVLAGDELPEPGTAASAARWGDLDRVGSIVTADDPDRTEASALTQHGLAAVASFVLSEHGGRRLAVRGAVEAGNGVPTELIEGFRLLAGQASVALQNEQLMTEVTEMHDELEHRALHDGLTGLPNRTYLLRQLRQAQVDRAPIAVLFLDLDGFKPVNDRLGHDVGDVLLQRVARRLQEAAPPPSVVARLGGDEFTILARVGDHGAARALADRVVEAVAHPFDLGAHKVTIGTSVGIALGDPDVDDAELIRRADVAMYEAKHGVGPGSVELYRPNLDSAADRRARLASDIVDAIHSGGLHLVYQPVFDVSERPRIVGAEALLRWNHPAYGRIPPPETVEAALAARVGNELNRFVVQTAVDWLATARRTTQLDGLFVTVNASPDELNSRHLVGNVRDAVDRAGVDPRHVAVEISERVVTPVTDTARRNMQDLQSMGARLLLDDFGEGTTSLAHLQELPIDGVKLDRKLVVNALRSRTDRLVLESIVKLSARLGHRVIAEGVETEEHLSAIISAGCILVQGFHLAAPLDGDDLISQLCGAGRHVVPSHHAPSHLAPSHLAPSQVDHTTAATAPGPAAPDWTSPLVVPSADLDQANAIVASPVETTPAPLPPPTPAPAPTVSTGTRG